jgi:hypothetical protein
LVIFTRRAAGAVILAVGVLGSVACAPGFGDDGGASRSRPRPAAPVSVPQYSATLAGAVRPLDQALDELGGAKGYNGLADRVTAARDAAERAVVALDGITPPPALAVDHSRLVTALRRSYTQLNGASGDVAMRRLCTGPAVRASLGDSASTPALRDAYAATTAKLPGERVPLSLPSAGERPGKRPSNGAFIRSGTRNGRGTLTIDNGGSTDALVTARKGNRTAFSLYVHAGRKTTVRSISDGSYTIYYSNGSDFDRKTRAFTRDCAFRRFEQALAYRTNVTAAQITWSTWTLTLHDVAGGNARTSAVDPGQFPEG